MKTLKNIIKIVVSNITSFGTSFIIGFILPLILSVTDYGYYKEFTLYLSFAYIFNFGFNDGIYIKYGGREVEELNYAEINEEHNFLVSVQTIIMIIMIIISILLNNLIFLFFSIATFITLVNTYHQNFFKATGEFDVYAKGSIFRSIFYISILLIAILIIKTSNYYIYIILYILSILYSFIYYEIQHLKIFGYSLKWDLKGKFKLYKVGFFILLANMSMAFVGNIGSWIVNFRFSIEHFAQYSFQNSVLNVILLIVNSVGLVFYNIIAKSTSQSLLQVTKEISLLLGVFSGIAYFIFAFIINTFLPEYTPSLKLLSMTFIAIPYIMISNILITNLYKARVSEQKYLKDSLKFSLFSFLFIFGAYLITNNSTAIALATTFCYIFWYLYSSKIQFSYLNGGKRESLLMLSHFAWFYISTNIFELRIGLVAYSIYLLVIVMLYQDRFKKILKMYIRE